MDVAIVEGENPEAQARAKEAFIQCTGVYAFVDKEVFDTHIKQHLSRTGVLVEREPKSQCATSFVEGINYITITMTTYEATLW
jgi:hypothetical protein